MRRLFASLLVLAAVTLSGCGGEKEAREYAAKMIPVLDSYQEQLSQKIKAEQASYQELAKTYEQARQDDIKTRLENGRARRSEELGEETAKSDTPPSLLEIFESLQDYATEDFKTTQTLLQESLDSRAKYLSGLESLEVELQKIKLLKEALTELAKSKSDFRKFKNAADSLLKTHEGFDKLLCVDLQKALDDLTEQKKTANDKDKKEIEQKIERLKDRMKTKKCG
jgi:hypothetical protein